MTFGHKIAILRAEKGLSQQGFSLELGVAQSTIARYECGMLKEPSFFFVNLVANYFGITLSELFDGVEGIETEGRSRR